MEASSPGGRRFNFAHNGMGMGSKVAAFVLGVGFMATVELAVLTWGDLAQINAARHAAYEAGTWGLGSPGATGAVPRVALMFLVQKDLPTEPLWQLFLDAASLVVEKAVPHLQRTAHEQHGWQQLFSVYVHPEYGQTLPADSLFAGMEVPVRVAAAWGNHSMVDAQRALLLAALQDPRNQRFVLLSEACIPVYSAPVVYAHLLAVNRSRINACRNESDPQDADRRMVGRYQWGMLQANITKDTWRKSSQWFVLNRRHAELVMRDQKVDAAFRQHCYTSKNWAERYCPSDEHYIPTLLAWHGLDAETTCGGSTYTHWKPRAAHPSTFGRATPDVLVQLRGNCTSGSSSALDAAATKAIGRVLQPRWLGRRAAAGLHSGMLSIDAASLLPTDCPLFARKIPAWAVDKWHDVLAPVMWIQ